MQYPDVNGKEKLIRRDGACRVSPIAGEVRHPGRSGLASGSMGWAGCGWDSTGDAQLLLDLGHYRAGQARLAEFREVLSDDVLP
jgi:hypothetical protein